MNESAAAVFEEQRDFLTNLASKITGNRSDAEELVTQAYLRWNSITVADIENPRAFLATVVTRLALNQKSSARARLEVAVDPEHIARLAEAEGDEVGGLVDALSGALEIVLSRLSPIERAVFLLREVFQIEYQEISSLLDESDANCRQILKRSREKIVSAQPRFRPNTHDCELAASRDGNLDDLMSLVAPGVALNRDAGDIGAACPPPLFGAEALFTHTRIFLARNPGANWTSFRIGNAYQVAMVHGAQNKPVSAFISAINNEQKLSRVDHITCPTRLLMLCKLVGSTD